MRRVRETFIGERTVRIGPDGVLGRFPHGEILSYWSGITEIAEDGDYIFFFTDRFRAHVIPKRVFAAETDQTQFRESAKAYWKASRG